MTGKKKLEEVTFEDFVDFASGGITGRDRLASNQVARVAAARVIALLNLEILPEQSLLVDAPHLVSRFPSLLSNESGAIESWNLLCNPLNSNIAESLSGDVKPYKFEKEHWLWRPAWYWPEIKRDEVIREVKEPWNFEEPGWVFCEDISRFVPFEDAQDFTAIVSPPFIKRFISRRNAAVASDHVDLEEPTDTSQVEYVPESVLSL